MGFKTLMHPQFEYGQELILHPLLLSNKGENAYVQNEYD